MRTKCLIGFCILLLCETAFAQGYYPFPESGAEWSENSNSCVSYIPPCDCFADGWLFSEGRDTLISGIKYILIGYDSTWNKFYVSGGSVISAENYNYTIPGLIFGAIRNDAQSKKIWFRKLKNFDIPVRGGCVNVNSLFPLDSDIILYDFNLKIGDSLLWKPTNRILTGIDSIQISDGSYRRKFIFSYDDYWIEGIGSWLGLFGSYEAPPNAYGGCWLTCFQKNDSLLYPVISGSDYYCNRIFTGFSEFTTKFSISVFPNPASTYVHFDFRNYSNQKLRLIIMNSVSEGSIRFDVNYQKELDIPVSLLGVEGLYFYQIFSRDKKIFSGKFLIQRQ